jgi:dienelactone hydrolase
MLTRRTPLAFSLLLLGGCVAISGPSITTTASNGGPEQIPARTYKPEGAGPFPAVVIAHDCSGLGPNSSGAPGRWADKLVQWGYVVIIPDSYTTRGHPGGICTDDASDRSGVTAYRRARDAYAALAYLRTLPYVDGARIGLMGGSAGGSTTLASMFEPEGNAQPPAKERREGFAAAVALYPGCRMRFGNWRADLGGVYKSVAPLLILVGEKDDWTPAEPCRRLAEASQRAGYPVSIKIYPGTYHSFDSPMPPRYIAERVNPNSPTGHGATTGGNAEAWADSIREVEEFFGRHLRQARQDGPAFTRP